MLMPFWYVLWDSGRSLISKHLLKNGDRCPVSLVHQPTMVTNQHLVSDWCSSYPLQIINPTINRPLKMLSSCTIHVISRLDQCQCWIPIWIDHFPTIFHENPVFPRAARLLKESVQGHCSSHGRYKDHHLPPFLRPTSGPDSPIPLAVRMWMPTKKNLL